MSRRILLVTTLLLAGCTSEAPAPTPPPPPAKSGFKLVAFDSCEQLTKDLKAAAKASVGPWGFSGSLPSPGGGARGIDAVSHKATGRLQLDAWGDADLLLSGDRALVLTQGSRAEVLYD